MTNRSDTESSNGSAPVVFSSDPVALADPLGIKQAREQLAAHTARTTVTSLIDYRASNQCLVVAASSEPEALDAALEIVSRCPALKISILCPLPESADETQMRRELTEDGTAVYYRQLATVDGYLGQFDVQVHRRERESQPEHLGVLCRTETGLFDLLLDLGTTPVFGMRLPPFGYFHATDESALERAVADLPNFVGDFEKPKYFDYKADICAHSRSELNGCNKCLDICATNAISHAGEGVMIDPHLCQGCGHCATVCPSGAMTYAYPAPATAIDSTRQMLRGKDVAVTGLLIYSINENQNDTDTDTESGQSLETLGDHLPDSVVAVTVEEVGSLGMDFWSAMVASGIRKIVVMGQTLSADLFSGTADTVPSDIDPGVVAIQKQADILNRILSGIGFPDDVVDVITEVPVQVDDLVKLLASRFNDSQLADDHPVQQISAASFATHNDKRATIRSAIDHLHQHLPETPEVVDLPEQSPFGQIAVDSAGCTLCLACVSTCPAGALTDGQSLPQLRFIEANCLQCGLCQEACPENVITLQPRYLVDSGVSRQARVLNEEEPFNCVRCHKPFATRKMIDNMTTKLGDHWMFGDNQALRRLKMCEDCRVKDIFEASEAGITVHRDSSDS